MKETEKQFLEAVEEAKRRLAAGEKPKNVFGWYGDFFEGFARVGLGSKWNFIDHNGKFLSDTWFDYCVDFYEGFAWVRLEGKYNYIGADGKFLSDTWFDGCGNFRRRFALVKLNDKCYHLRNDGVLCDYDTKEPIKMEE